jgi:hypothetical protein
MLDHDPSKCRTCRIGKKFLRAWGARESRQDFAENIGDSLPDEIVEPEYGGDLGFNEPGQE